MAKGDGRSAVAAFRSSLMQYTRGELEGPARRSGALGGWIGQGKTGSFPPKSIVYDAISTVVDS